MKRYISFFRGCAAAVPWTVLALAVSCSGKEPPLVTSDYSQWKRTHRTELDYPIPGHEDRYRRIFISPEGENPRVAAVNGRVSYSYPEGTRVVKEIFSASEPFPGRKPETLTVMLKAPRDPRARGGWLWIVKDAATGNETIFAEEFCVTCHANANERHPYGDKNPKDEFRDYLFFPYPEPLKQ